MKKSLFEHLGIFFSVIFIDQLSKLLILKYYLGSARVFLLPTSVGSLGIQPTINPRLAFSIAIPQIMLIILIPIVVFFLVYLLMKKIQERAIVYSIILSLISGAAVSNWLDRVGHGGVIDFISLKLLTLDFAIFNLADLVITIGVCIILLIELNIIKTKI